MFNTSLKDYGVVKFESTSVKVFETQSKYSTINVGEPIQDARWTGSTVTVYLRNGKVRKYSSLSFYTNVG
jgi:hypothetical protein